jgi:hypothetical protein
MRDVKPAGKRLPEFFFSKFPNYFKKLIPAEKKKRKKKESQKLFVTAVTRSGKKTSI